MAQMRTILMASFAGLCSVASLPTAAAADERVVREYHSYSYETDDDDDYDRDRREYREEYREPVERQTTYYYEERPRYERRTRESRYDRDACRTDGTTGAIIGGAVGALLGRGVDRHGDRTVGTLLGAGGGAVVGHEIDSQHRC